MNSAPKRPDTRNEELIEETFEDVGKAARGVWDFFTSDDNKEFCKKIDERHGTQLGELHARIRAGRNGENTDSGRHAGCVHNPPCPGPRCTVYAVAEPQTPRVPERIVVIELPDGACAFCEGKQVIAKKGDTRTPIACPTCRKNPSAKPKRSAR